MPRIFGSPYERADGGSVAVERPSPVCAEVLYIPSEERLQHSDIDELSTSLRPAKLLHIDGMNQILTIYPINTFPSVFGPHAFLGQKYSNIESITIEDWSIVGLDIQQTMFPEPEGDETTIEDFGFSDQEKVMLILEDLPSYFVKDYDYGLGLTKPYRFIIDAVESLSECTKIVISKKHATGIEVTSKTFYIFLDDLESARKSIDRTIRHSQTAARSVNYAATRNLFAEKTGKPPIPIRTGRSPLRKLLTEAAIRGDDTLTQDEQDEMLDLFTKNTKSLLVDKPQRLATIKADIELVTLEDLIERYLDMMQARTPERQWQRFLNANPFILSLAFGYPVVKVRDQASVGGHRISGAGETIADFLLKNSLTNNCAIVEIKTPRTRLLNKSSYRGSVFTPSSHLVGAVNQALQQKGNFEKEISRIKDSSRIYDIESYAVSCCLVIGTMPDEEARKQSFELFRGNSKNVQIVTFDELLIKLTNLRDLLTGPEVETNVESDLIQLPF